MENLNVFKSLALAEFDRISRRINYRQRSWAAPIDVAMQFEDIKENDQNLWLTFRSADRTQQVAFPVPHKDDAGNLIIGGDVQRAVGTWFLTDKNKEVSYWDLMYILLTDRIESYFPGVPGVGKRSQMEKIIRSFEFRRAPMVVRSFQRLINEVTNKLPVCGTPMQVWAMNNRVIFLDPEHHFESMTPKQILDYQTEKNKKFFPWSCVGLSDSTMVKNYMLKVDLRKYSPFCIKHHSPMRNLYQPLGMTGPEKPAVTTRSAERLEQAGVGRGGWNWMTAFVDLPLNFEDQVIVSARHQDKVNTSTRQYIAFGTPCVRVGDIIARGDVISFEPGNRVLMFQAHADMATVVGMGTRIVPLNGSAHSATVITVELRRQFKDGFKFTNLHGNKGIAVFANTGTMYDPIRKREVDIDIIVAAKTVGNRKNFGQLFEALSTMITGPGKSVVLEDDHHCDIQKVKSALEKVGMPSSGVCDLKTQWGKFKAICGWVFWGLLKEPEDSLWEKSDVVRTNQIGMRISGNKVSHIELRALRTIFGPGSGVIREILSHQEGMDIVREFVRVLKTMEGVAPKDVPQVSWDNIKIISQSAGFLHRKEELMGTIADQTMHPNGFIMKLPFGFKTTMPKGGRGVPEETGVLLPIVKEEGSIVTDSVYVPAAEMREPWQHQSGLWGITDVAGLLNTILIACRDFTDKKATLIDSSRTLHNYFHFASKKLSTKTGLISTYCLAIRYPMSVKATATVTNKLPPNTIEIHRDMARDLKVKHGDFLLVERFPCLGFMSVRVQKVHVTDDSACKFVIRVSGNSLNSLALDFDGDVLFIMSFQSDEAKADLEYEFRFPNKDTVEYIKAASDKKKPHTWQATLDDFAGFSLKNGQPPMTFAKVGPEVQSKIVGALAGIKVHTGTCVALGYNISRITEGSVSSSETEINAGIEVMLDKIANSVFGSKHAMNRLLESVQ